MLKIRFDENGIVNFFTQNDSEDNYDFILHSADEPKDFRGCPDYYSKIEENNTIVGISYRPDLEDYKIQKELDSQQFEEEENI